MPSKYLGNPKYVKQLEDHYGAVNAILDAHKNYVNLSCQDKVILSQQSYEMPAMCCVISGDIVVWNTWDDSFWNLDENAWNTVWSS